MDYSKMSTPPTASKSKPKPKKKGKWVPICKFAAYDFDEDKGVYSEAMGKVELQQEVKSKRIRAVVVAD